VGPDDHTRIRGRGLTAGPGDHVASTVPLMKFLRADLALAGIPYTDEAGRYVDLHSLRVSLSTLLPATRSAPGRPKR